MAKGPHSSDAAQRYILQALKARKDAERFDEIFDISDSHNGREEWSIGEVFEDKVLMEFEGQTKGTERLPDYGFKALDNIYGVIEHTSDGNNRLEGLRTIASGDEFPVSGRTERDWKQNYREAGLVDDNAETFDVTPEGEVFLDTHPSGYEFDDLDIDDVGSIYRDLTTKKIGDKDDPTGQKIKAFFLYGAGMNHTDVSEETGLTYSTTKNFAYSMKDDHGLLTDNYRLSPEGFEFANMMLDQMDLLEEVTDERVQDEYDGDRSSIDPKSFEGNNYMAQTLNNRN